MATTINRQSPALSPDRRNQLRECYSQRHARFIERHLKEEQLRVIENTPTLSIRDVLNVARAHALNQNHPSIAGKIDKDYIYTDYQHRRNQETPWMEQMAYLIGTRTGNAPTNEDFRQEIESTNLGQVFKVFYCLTFRDLIKKKPAA